MAWLLTQLGDIGQALNRGLSQLLDLFGSQTTRDDTLGSCGRMFVSSGAVCVLSRGSSMACELVERLLLQGYSARRRRVLLVRLACGTARERSFEVEYRLAKGVVAILSLLLHVGLVWRQRGLLFWLLLLLLLLLLLACGANGGQQFHGIGKDIGQIKSTWRQAVLAGATLGCLRWRDPSALSRRCGHWRQWSLSKVTACTSVKGGRWWRDRQIYSGRFAAQFDGRRHFESQAHTEPLDQ